MATKVKEKKSRWIHTFSINKEKEVEDKEISKDEDGQEITVIKKVIKEVPVNFMLKRPTRKLLDRADLFYSVKLSEGIKAGLLTRTLLARRYDDDGGLWSQEDQGSYFEVYDQLVERENEYHKLTLNLAKDLSDNKQKETEKVLREITDLRRKLSQYEEIQQSIFNNTAENRARNQTIMWWVLNLSYKEADDGKAVPVFEGKTHEEKLDSYDDIEEEFDDFTDEMIKKLAFFISFWYTGKISEPADFKIAEDIYKTNNGDIEDDEELDVETEKKIQEIHMEKVKDETKVRREQLEKTREGQKYSKAARETKEQLDKALMDDVNKTIEEKKTQKKKRAKKRAKTENEEKQEE